MARGRQTRRIPDWRIGLAITCVVLGMAWVRPAFLESIEYQTFDLRLRWFGSRAPAQKIAIVALDEESISKLGRWPWPRSPIAAPAFQGKIVLVGATARGIGDVEPTPLAPVFPGVEKHANLIANIQAGQFLRRLAGPGSSLGPVRLGQRTTVPGSAATHPPDA